MNTSLFDRIESQKFSVEINVVSGFTQFIRAIGYSKPVRELMEAIRTPEDGEELLLRTAMLALSDTDPKYENPNDVAVGAYLWVLAVANPSSVNLAAEVVLDCQGFWWARQMAARLLAQRAPKNEATVVAKPAQGRPEIETKAVGAADCGAVYVRQAPAVERRLGGQGKKCQANRYAHSNMAFSRSGGASRNKGTANKKGVAVYGEAV
jgi:hypothetical protein